MTKKTIEDKEPISKQIARRLLPANERAGEFAITYRQMAPIFGRNIEGLRELINSFSRLQAVGKKLLGELEAIYGYVQEGREVADVHADELAQLTTLMVNLDVFLQADPEMLFHVLNIADPPVMKEAALRLDSERLVLLQQAVNEAVDEFRETRKEDDP